MKHRFGNAMLVKSLENRSIHSNGTVNQFKAVRFTMNILIHSDIQTYVTLVEQSDD